MLVLFMVDMRVRELWLKPIDGSLIHYAAANAGGLRSGFDFFFKTMAVFTLTFQRFLFIVVIAHLCIWALIAWHASRSTTPASLRWTRSGILAAAAAATALSVLALSAPHYRYRMNENIIVAGPISWLKSAAGRRDYRTEKLAASFEQKPVPLRTQLAAPRNLLEGAEPFTNVVLVVYESMRWRDLNLLGDGPTLAPALRRMAADGIVSKCYVAVPHSAKSYYALMTGRYPYPGIEMREVLKETNATIWRQLHESKGISPVAVSSQNLSFESMGTLLNSFGISARETRDLPEARGLQIASTSSFGSSDTYLYSLGTRSLAGRGAPFAAVFFPLAAHYPYDCAGSDTARHDLADYQHCVAESDANLSGFLQAMKQAGLTQNTLFVIVGDHGESFGEHGLFVHNSSMYEEEVTVPLVLWSEDGRLGHHVLPYSRQIDIAPTIADLMGVLDSSVPVQGVSLLRRADPLPPAFMSTFFDDLGAALVEPPFKYIYDPSTNRMLAFNDANDPGEESPLELTAAKVESETQRIRAFLAYQKLLFGN